MFNFSTPNINKKLHQVRLFTTGEEGGIPKFNITFQYGTLFSSNPQTSNFFCTAEFQHKQHKRFNTAFDAFVLPSEDLSVLLLLLSFSFLVNFKWDFICFRLQNFMKTHYFSTPVILQRLTSWRVGWFGVSGEGKWVIIIISSKSQPPNCHR